MSSDASTTPRKRGRPPNATSAETRARLIDSARRHFAQQGLDRATMSDIARGARIGPSAFYRYFPDKETLYEAVFEETISHLWDVLDRSTQGHRSARDAITALVEAADRAREGLPDYPGYLSNLPYEAARHPRFATLVTRRIETQRATFRTVAALGRSTGEFDDALTIEQLSENLRVLVMGWLVERNLHPDDDLLSPGGLLHLLGLD